MPGGSGPKKIECVAIDEPMYVRYAREVKQNDGGQEYRKTIYHRINYLIVYYLGTYFCLLDAAASRGRKDDLTSLVNEDKKEEVDETTALRQRGSLWKRNSRFGYFPRVIVTLFFVSLAYLLVALYYQYAYDFDRLRLLKLEGQHKRCSLATETSRSVPADCGADNVNKLDYKQDILTRMSETRSFLKYIRADSSRLTILTECFYLIVFIQAGIILLFYLHYCFMAPFDNHVVRDLLDKSHEDYSLLLLVKRQVDDFIESSRVHYKNTEFECLFDCTHEPLKLVGGRDSRPAKDDDNGRRNKREACERLAREMLSCGALTPLYQSRTWLVRRTNLQLCCYSVLALFVIIFDAILLGSLLLLTNNKESSSASSRSLLLAACLSIMLIDLPTIILQPTIVMITVIEQNTYIEQLRSLIRQCITTNLRTRTSSCSNKSTRSPWCNDQHQSNSWAAVKRGTMQDNSTSLIRNEQTTIMNSNLIFCLLHYKIFVVQMVQIKRSLGVLNVLAYMALFAMSIIARIHEPYLSQMASHESALGGAGRFANGQIKIFAMAMSASISLMVTFSTAPICSMFARCQRLYKDLSSLAAHIIESKQQAHVSCSPESFHKSNIIYDNYAECCLLRELSDSQRFLDTLTIRAFGVSGTYTIFVKAYFWYGLLTISIMASGDSNAKRNGQDLLGWLSSQDPLGVFN